MSCNQQEVSVHVDGRANKCHIHALSKSIFTYQQFDGILLSVIISKKMNCMKILGWRGEIKSREFERKIRHPDIPQI